MVNWSKEDIANLEQKKSRKRVQKSIGIVKHNIGSVLDYTIEKYKLDNSRTYYSFNIVPMGKPRMTQSDKWKTDINHKNPKQRKRISVHKYHLWKDQLLEQAKAMEFELKVPFEAVYFIPMPESWSKKKKEKMVGMPHESKPDIDNITKGIFDCICKSDSHIWKARTEKRWAYNGSIIIFQ